MKNRCWGGEKGNEDNICVEKNKQIKKEIITKQNKHSKAQVREINRIAYQDQTF